MELRWGRDTWQVRRLVRMATTAMLHMLARLMDFMGRAGLLAACLLGLVRGTAAGFMAAVSIGRASMEAASIGPDFTDAGGMAEGITVTPVMSIAAAPFADRQAASVVASRGAALPAVVSTAVYVAKIG